MSTVLGRWIVVLRIDCGLTRRNLAERLGVAPSTLARWECDSETVPTEYLGKLAEALHVPVDDLMALHAQSSRRLKPRNSETAPARRVTRYPVAGTPAEMFAFGGGLAVDIYTRVSSRLKQRTHAEVLEKFPRDSAVQLMATHHLLACGADVRKLRLLELGCSLLVMQRTRKVYDGDRDRYALILPGDDWLLVLVPQVSLAVPGCPQIYRADFLGLYVDGYGHRQWVDITVDSPRSADDVHADCPSVLGLPRFHYTPEMVLLPNFGVGMVGDIRRFMISDVVHPHGVTTLRVRQPARLDPPSLKPRAENS